VNKYAKQNNLKVFKVYKEGGSKNFAVVSVWDKKRDKEVARYFLEGGNYLTCNLIKRMVNYLFFCTPLSLEKIKK